MKYFNRSMSVRSSVLVLALLVLLTGGASAAPARSPTATEPQVQDSFRYRSPSFAAFETGPVRPMALSVDRKRLFVVNTPDNRLEIFNILDGELTPAFSVSVGMEPVSVAVRDEREVWVVNHLSDSISIVSLTDLHGYVSRTLYVGDEPRDIVFAGGQKKRAFVTAAHRGQNAPFDPQLETPGIGRADVWVFDPTNLGNVVGGTPAKIINLFSDTPRALAVSEDGGKVYAAAFHSGNQTTVLNAEVQTGGVEKLGPSTDIAGAPQPLTGLIVRFDGKDWVDDGDPVTGKPPKVWTDWVKLSMPDKDVFVIDSTNDELPIVDTIAGVGTTLFNMAVHPKSGHVFVSNLDARNHVRFATKSAYGDNLNGHFIENQISIVAEGRTVSKRNLNKHINSYDDDFGTDEEKRNSLALPLGMAFTQDGKKLFVTAYGSQSVGVFDVESFEDDTFRPDAARYIQLSSGGPAAIVLNEDESKLYVYTRFNNAVTEVDINTFRELEKHELFNPEPKNLLEGRAFLYDARLTSSRGDSACGSCHIFGDTDHLAWDLGDPHGLVKANPNEYAELGHPEEKRAFFHPLKGPMVTQSMRGIAGNGPMHWRGDRTGAGSGSGQSVEERAFKEFNAAFVELQGREKELTDEDMHKFTEFALQLVYPPNPIRNLDNSLTTTQQQGADLFRVGNTENTVDCNTCHENDPAKGRFGTNGLTNISEQVNGRFEDFKIPHLRNMYTKVGKFGSTRSSQHGRPFMGDQIRGFGFNHDGAHESIDRALAEDIFFFPSEELKRAVIDFTFVINGEMNPIVGQQVTVNADNWSDDGVGARVDLLLARAKVVKPVRECDLVVSGVVDGREFGAVLNDSGRFETTAGSMPSMTPKDMRSLSKTAGTHLTYACVPPGSGRRIGIARRS